MAYPRHQYYLFFEAILVNPTIMHEIEWVIWDSVTGAEVPRTRVPLLASYREGSVSYNGLL